MNLFLEGKIALVSGGAKGIGKACVETLISEGAKVVTVDADRGAGQALEARFPEEQFIFIHGDLTDTELCRETVSKTVGHFGGLDVLINNAGVNDFVGLDQPPENFLHSLERNIIHVYALTHFAAEHLKKSKGAIVNVGSKVSITGQRNTSGYAAAKGGINALTREWALEFAGAGVRVNAVLPAEVDTDLYQKRLATYPDPEKMRRSIEVLIPLEKRFTMPQELASTIVFLASPCSSHTTGQIVFVDGGYTHLDRALGHLE